MNYIVISSKSITLLSVVQSIYLEVSFMTEITFTKETLAEYNGQNGSKPFVAVDGIVYDLSDVKPWKDGKHFKGLTAGRDLTDFFANSHHTPSTLKNIKRVGTYQA